MILDALRLVNAVLFLVGFGLYAWASVFRRLPGAPGVGGGGRHYPWQHRDWFTPRGYLVRVIGFWTWMFAALGNAILWMVD